jgi:hypothetical protein
MPRGLAFACVGALAPAITPAQAGQDPGLLSSDLALAPTRSRPALLIDWVATTSDEIIGSGTSGSAYLPDEHPATRRVQFWIDQLDGWLRREDPERFATERGEVPRPIVHLRIDQGSNAFVSSATVCRRVPIRFAGRSGSGPGESIVLVHPRGSLGLYARSQLSCLDRMDTVLDAEVVRRFLVDSLRLKNCSVTVREGVLEFGRNCRMDPTVEQQTAAGVALKTTSNHLSIDTGLLALLPDEGQLVSAILHELAHFYRAHGSLAKSAFRYFYNLDAPLAPQPPADPALDALGKQLVALGSFRTQPIQGQEWHSEIFSYGRYTAQLLVNPTCTAAESPCHEACKPWRGIMDDPQVMAQFGSFPQGLLTGASLELYVTWEATFSRCLASLRIAAAADSLGAKVALEDVKKVFWRPSYETQTYATVLDAARAMSADLEARDRARDALLEQALHQRVGYYTTEEEADNLAMQWLPTLGFPPSLALDQWWTYAAYRKGSEQETPYNFSYERCLALYKAVPAWTEDGRLVPVPVGSYGQDHHSSCFRIHNLHRRWLAQRWPIGPSLIAEAEAVGGPYAELRHAMRELSVGAIVPPPLKLGQPDVIGW